MELNPLLLAVFNCCGIPLIAFGIGVWWAKGMPGSPFIIARRNKDDMGLYDD